MNKDTLKEKFSQRVNINDVKEIIQSTRDNDECIQALYELTFDDDEKNAYQAAWVLTHLSSEENTRLFDKQDELIDEVLSCTHTGKRRLFLSLLLRQPQANPPRADFFNFCMERMMSVKEPPSVKSLCMKLAYEMCRPFPELLQELRATLELMDADLLIPSMSAVRKNVLKAMKKEKSLK